MQEWRRITTVVLDESACSFHFLVLNSLAEECGPQTWSCFKLYYKSLPTMNWFVSELCSPPTVDCFLHGFNYLAQEDAAMILTHSQRNGFSKNLVEEKVWIKVSSSFQRHLFNNLMLLRNYHVPDYMEDIEEKKTNVPMFLRNRIWKQNFRQLTINEGGKWWFPFPAGCPDWYRVRVIISHCCLRFFDLFIDFRKNGKVLCLEMIANIYGALTLWRVWF